MDCHYGADYHRAITSSGETRVEKRWLPARRRVLQMVQGGALLDIGCSSGGFLQTLRSAEWNLYGIEMSPAQARRAQANSGASVFIGGILDAPFSASSFDIITGFHVLEHVHQPKEVIGKLWEWLKPDGILYLTVPNIDALDSHIFGSFWYGLELPRHLYHFSPASLRRLFASFDFDQVLLRTMPYTHLEGSLPFVIDELRAKIGFAPSPNNAEKGSPGMAWRIVRKALRLGILNPLGLLAAGIGRGAGIEVILRKREISSKDVDFS
jgi:SAM-dependent methyltransferase